MARVQTMVQLSEELVRLLDGEAAKRGLSRSALIREVLEAALADERNAEIGRQIAEGYRRIPPGTPDEWGDLEKQTEQRMTDALHRLNAEERAAGHPPW
jgi:predicted transcriptional regulator